MTLNPKIPTTFLWFCITLAALPIFAAGIVYKIGLFSIVALPVMLLAPYLSLMGALAPDLSTTGTQDEPSEERRKRAEAAAARTMPRALFLFATVIIAVGLTPKPHFETHFVVASFLVLGLMQLYQLVQTIRLRRRFPDRRLTLSLATQLLAFAPHVFWIANLVQYVIIRKIV